MIGSIAPNGSSISITRRVGGERAGDADPLALAARELRRVAVARCSRVEADELEQLVDARARCASLVPAEQPRHGGDVLGRSCGAGTGRSAGSRSRSRAAARPACGRARCWPPSRMSPLGDLDHAVDHPHRGRLAAARRADQHADLARRDRRARGASTAGSVCARVALRRLAELKRCCRRARRRPRGAGRSRKYSQREGLPGEARDPTEAAWRGRARFLKP